MLRRNRAAAVKESAVSGKELAVALAQDKKFRKELVAAVGHGVVARRRAARRLGIVAAIGQLAADEELRRELRQMTQNAQKAWARAEKKRSNRLRNTVIFLLASGGAAAAALPQSRQWLMDRLSGPSLAGMSPRAHDS